MQEMDSWLISAKSGKERRAASPCKENTHFAIQRWNQRSGRCFLGPVREERRLRQLHEREGHPGRAFVTIGPVRQETDIAS